MAKRKQETNEQFMKRLMISGACPSGALIQAFVLTAVEKYAEQCIAAGPEVFESGFMSGAAWVKTAEYARDEVKKHLA